MKRYQILTALALVLFFVLYFPGLALAQGGGDDDEDGAPVDGEAGFSAGPSSPDLTSARGTGANGLQPEGFNGGGEATLASTTLVISEIWNGGLDGVEIQNKSAFFVNFNAWQLFVYSGTGSSFQLFKSLPNCWIAPGGVFRIYEGAGPDSCGTLTFYFGFGTNIDWGENIFADGAVSLRNSSGTTIDFMRFGGNSFVPGGADWRGFNPMSANGMTQSLQRVSGGFDDDWGDNFCVAGASMGTPNSITSCPENYIKITEVDTGEPDRLEIYNAGTRSVNLVGSIMNLNDITGEDSVFTPTDTHTILPIDLTPGSRVVFVEGSGTNTTNTQYMPGVSIGWLNTLPDGWTSIQEFGTINNWHDLVWFGNVNLVNPTYNPAIHVNGYGLSRTAASSGAVPYSPRQGQNWCAVPRTIGSANIACPAEARLVINELTPGTPDVLEIYNAGARAVNLRNTRIDFIKATSPYGFDYTYTFGGLTIWPFQHIEVREFSGTNDFNTRYTGQNIDWINGRGGAELRDNGNLVGDFVRLRDSTYTPKVTPWFGTLSLLFNENRSHGRSPNGFDTNSASNFCEQNNTFVGPNAACVGAGTPLAASVTCVDPNMHVTITSGDGPFNITASEGQNLPRFGVSTGTTIIFGPDRWRDVTVTETSGDNQSALLEDRIVCRSTEETILQFPPHQSHTTDTTPFFNWSDTTDANRYRIFIFDDRNPAVRTIDVRAFSPVSSWTPVNPLPTMRLFWRARARVNNAWGYWSVRWTLFIDPSTLQEEVVDGEVPIMVASGQTPVPAQQLPGAANGGIQPNREDVAAAAPLPLEIAPDVTGLTAYEAESLKSMTGAWAMRGDAHASGSTMIVSSGQPSDALTINFTGDRFGLQYGTFPGGGNLQLVIDEQPMGIINTDATAGFNLKVFGLSAGVHTARLYSTDGIIAIDTVYAAGLVEPVNDNAESEGSSSTGDGSVPPVQVPPVSTEPDVEELADIPAPPNSR